MSAQAIPRILVVDDEPLTRWSIAETLGDCGYQVTEAHDAASALRAFENTAAHSDVVLLDLSLPDSDGFQVLTAMHMFSPATPVIIMTVYSSPQVSDEARHLGAFAVVDKPFELADLAQLVARALSGVRHRQANELPAAGDKAH